MANKEIPKPSNEAYFPPSERNAFLTKEVLRRAGSKNLVYALEYGSYVTGDASPTSIHDVMIVVDDALQFHKDNLILQQADYGSPQNARWHTYLNTFGYNFYMTQYRGENEEINKAKIAVISQDNFIKGCSGTFKHPQGEREGAFGLYVAGRIQKAALSPLYKREDLSTAAIECAINTARIDGVWFALGFLEKNFSYEELLHAYVSLSYKADVRVEKKGKVDTLIAQSGNNYRLMLQPIIDEFKQSGLIKQTKEGYEKIESLTQDEVKKRLGELKYINFLTNYLKNPFTGNFAQVILYALAKLSRAKQSDIKK